MLQMISYDKRAVELTHLFFNSDSDDRIYLVISSIDYYGSQNYYDVTLKITPKKKLSLSYKSDEKPMVILCNNTEKCVKLYDDIPVKQGIYRVDLLLQNQNINVESIKGSSRYLEEIYKYSVVVNTNDSAVYELDYNNDSGENTCRLFFYKKDLDPSIDYLSYSNSGDEVNQPYPDSVVEFFENCFQNKNVNVSDFKFMVEEMFDNEEYNRFSLSYKNYDISIEYSIIIQNNKGLYIVIPHEQVGFPSMVITKVLDAINSDSLVETIKKYFNAEIHYDYFF